MKNTGLSFGVTGALALAISLGLGGSVQGADAPTVINLTQTGCQFIESEGGVDHGYKTTSAKDCEAINAKTAKDRLAKAAPLVLKPGKYVFRVSNKNVPYGLGFWLRGSGFGRVTLPSVSGGGLNTGVTLDYAVELKPGEYVYSCPLNPTPDYALVVKG